MANIFKTLFGGGRKRDLNLGEQSPYKSLTDIPTGRTLNEQILAGLSGQGLGFGEGFVERTTSPFVQAREARFSEEELPFLSSELSGRGLGRSTIAGQEIGRAATRKERDINQLIAEANMRDLQQRKADEARLQNLAFNFAQAEAGHAERRAADTMARRQFQIGQDAARDARELSGINRAIGLGLTTIPQFASTLAGGGFGNVAQIGGDSFGTGNISNLLNLARQAKIASPFTKKKQGVE